MTIDRTSASMPKVSDRAATETDISSIIGWLHSVCRRSELKYDQVFIYRAPSTFSKIFKNNRTGEIKAIGMPDLSPVTIAQFRILTRDELITRVRSRWPGVWFKVNATSLTYGREMPAG